MYKEEKLTQKKHNLFDTYKEEEYFLLKYVLWLNRFQLNVIYRILR